MIFRKNQLLIFSSLLILSSAMAGTSQVLPQKIAPPKISDLGFFNDQQIDKLSSNFVAEAKRIPAEATVAGTEDMLSKQYIQFRDELLKVKSGTEFYSLIKKYDETYDQIPPSANDLKFTIARMATWLPLQGIVWRMTPMVHKIATTQAVLLATLKNFAEQVKINTPDSHVEAQMLFLTMPTPELVGKEFKSEADFVTFLGTSVYESLRKSVKRLETISMSNVTAKGVLSPILFDAKIRFGDNAFNNSYDDYERFKVVGEADRFAALARTHRRMYSIAFMAAYNWNGHFELKKEIGKLYGVGIAESNLFDALPGADDDYLRGVSREKRTAVINKYTKLYTLTAYGQEWMNNAYFHLHMAGKYLGNTWQNIKKNTGHYAAQLDPEIFMARKEQVEVGIMNINKLVGAYGEGVSGVEKINGTLSGDEIVVNVKGFYESAPKDLKKLLPISFAKNEDLNNLKGIPLYSSMTEAKSGSDVLKVTFPGIKKSVHFRNYLFGRSIGWNTSDEAYGKLFPKIKNPKEIARAMRILNETRGSRLLAGGLTTFVR